MDSSTQYQRAVTPTLDTQSIGAAGSIRGKSLSYQAQKQTSTKGKLVLESPTSTYVRPSGAAAGGGATGGVGGGGGGGGSGSGGAMSARNMSKDGMGVGMGDFNVQGRSASGRAGGGAGGASGIGYGQAGGSGASSSAVPPPSHLRQQSASVIMPELVGLDHSSTAGSLMRMDLIPLSEDIPSDGIIFARVRNQLDSLVVFRTPEERLRNPERLNLDRRQLEVCPSLEQEQRLRLLNFQNNNIRAIQNLENLPNLIFLDLYNNKLTSLEGPVSAVKGLRVLMAGKNKISAISNLTQLKKLDVLDLHSNDIRIIEGLDKLGDLRVLNLAGNRITMVQNLYALHALTELNLRRNKIDKVFELDRLPALQRVFLSHNLISRYEDMECLFDVKMLIELSLDGNPMSEADPVAYRCRMVVGMQVLRHLDLKRVTDEERAHAVAIHSEEMVRRLQADDEAAAAAAEKTQSAGGSGAGGGASTGSTEGAAATTVIDKSLDATSTGLAALARTGKLNSSQSMFDLEITGPNEKALIAVGDVWEWVQARRLLATVTEASLLHMKKETVVVRFSGNIASLPSLKYLRLVNNEIESIPDVIAIFDSLGLVGRSNLEDFTILDNPVCGTLLPMVKNYSIISLPKLRRFNDELISVEEKDRAASLMRPVLIMYTKSISGSGGGAGGLNATIADKIKRRDSAVNNYSRRSTFSMGHMLGTSSSSLAMDASYGAGAEVCNEITAFVADRRKLMRQFEETLNSVTRDIIHEAMTNVAK